MGDEKGGKRVGEEFFGWGKTWDGEKRELEMEMEMELEMEMSVEVWDWDWILFWEDGWWNLGDKKIGKWGKKYSIKCRN